MNKDAAMNPLLKKYVDGFNRGRIITGIVVVVIASLLCSMNGRFADNALNGPFPVKGSDLAAIKDLHSERKYYVVVAGQS